MSLKLPKLQSWGAAMEAAVTTLLEPRHRKVMRSKWVQCAVQVFPNEILVALESSRAISCIVLAVGIRVTELSSHSLDSLTGDSGVSPYCFCILSPSLYQSVL